MAYSSKHVSLGRIIENIYRESGYDQVDWESALEWTISIMKILGVNNMFVNKTTNGLDNNFDPIEIINYRGVIPRDVIKINACRRIALNSDGYIYKFAAMTESSDIFFDSFVKPKNTSVQISNPYFPTYEIDDNGNPIPIELTSTDNIFQNRDFFNYKIEGDIIFTNFESGYVEMSYKGISLDEQGLPNIPDDEKLIRAITWEIIWKLDKLNWRKNPSPQNKSILNDSGQERDFAISSARNKARIPSIDEMEGLKRMWLRSIQNVNEHGTNFKTLGLPEIRYNN
jgi:hypothetical protein